jgi:hypothetical protein
MLDDLAGVLLIVTRRVSRGERVMRWVSGLRQSGWCSSSSAWAGGAGCAPLCGVPALSLLLLVTVTLLVPLMLVQLALPVQQIDRADDHAAVSLMLFLGAGLEALHGGAPAVDGKRRCRLHHNLLYHRLLLLCSLRHRLS